jgi:predicted nucleic acid-binding protein
VIVVDASVIIEVLLQTDAGRAITGTLLDGRDTLHAPHLLDVEVAQVLRRFVLRGELYESRAREAIDTLRQFPLRRYPHEALLGRIWALRDNLTAYDAAYVALAEGLRSPLVTRDRRLAAAPGISTTVKVL